jgi:hypothetical protein
VRDQGSNGKLPTPNHLHSLIIQASELIAQLLSTVWSELLTKALDKLELWVTIYKISGSHSHGCEELWQLGYNTM